MGKRSAAGLLTSVDSIFTTQEERDNAQRSYVTDLSAAEISDFPNHPFKVRMDQSMVELADSVKQYGVLVPLAGAAHAGRQLSDGVRPPAQAGGGAGGPAHGALYHPGADRR